MAKLFAVLLSVIAMNALAQEVDEYDYFAADRQLVRNGMQAVLMCNGLFTSERTLKQVLVGIAVLRRFNA